VTDWTGRQTSFRYDPNGNWTGTTFPATSTNTDLYGFDRADQLTRVSWPRGATTLGSLSYAPRDLKGLSPR
jgi:YD repeat-containing protein